MRILVIGAGVIGSVYAARLSSSGHDVTVLARGSRLHALQKHGIELHDGTWETATQVHAVRAIAPDDSFDLVVVAVRAEQLSATVPVLRSLTEKPDVVFFGNLGAHRAEISAALPTQSFFGFPGVGGSQVRDVVHYVLIRQQPTTLGEASGKITKRVLRLGECLTAAGFPTKVSRSIDGWLVAHAAFIVPLGLALEASGGDPQILAEDGATISLLVDSTREVYGSLRMDGNTQIPQNLSMLYSRALRPFAISYWRRVMRDGRGELWFGAHGRAAPEETAELLEFLQADLTRGGHASASLAQLVAKAGAITSTVTAGRRIAES